MEEEISFAALFKSSKSSKNGILGGGWEQTDCRGLSGPFYAAGTDAFGGSKTAFGLGETTGGTDERAGDGKVFRASTVRGLVFGARAFGSSALGAAEEHKRASGKCAFGSRAFGPRDCE
ncbi:hypothetical protein AXG93_3865s1000 [Marchantia polymorpha subsp. ruderalis]|uniref:Uncharacterized protein n=1 Tax=Marchantia polymorpha subsp. ruderalis TaxID=1480154 RepID=A0A176W9I6_MARPO|nr:hypothetical protein AXG93_3865s1000 [Marchantia polymorpha subsp. ruderalis]